MDMINKWLAGDIVLSRRVSLLMDLALSFGFGYVLGAMVFGPLLQ